MFSSTKQSYTLAQRRLALLLCVMSLLSVASTASEISTTTTDNRNISLDGDLETCEDPSSTNKTNGVLSDSRCLLQESGSGANECESPSGKASNSEELIERGTFAMTRGMQFANHVKQIVRLVQAARQNNNGQNDRQRQATDAMMSKWNNIHEKAVHSLRESFDLYRQASQTDASNPELDENLRQVRESLVELHADELFPPSSVPLPTHQSTVMTI